MGRVLIANRILWVINTVHFAESHNQLLPGCFALCVVDLGMLQTGRTHRELANMFYDVPTMKKEPAC